MSLFVAFVIGAIFGAVVLLACAAVAGLTDRAKQAEKELRSANNLADQWHERLEQSEQQLAAAREVVAHARLAEFHFSQWEDGQFPGEKAHSLKYLRGEMEALRAALAKVQKP